ncbi:hypothetical protein OG455_04800 [Kitasatospora sp. NBC_01287]|uniref:hypothetical protein n=1 Tax=Kitasatospora sp. NBC_01287 TaxID=2903573 RepID=UPI00224E0D91|nr:hypothetical protein [Kitasatospora sp. NBC_01287]MCX4744845.1 hypothetical protein [Kitasatospora sp. NBC_01287]
MSADDVWRAPDPDGGPDLAGGPEPKDWPGAAVPPPAAGPFPGPGGQQGPTPYPGPYQGSGGHPGPGPYPGAGPYPGPGPYPGSGPYPPPPPFQGGWPPPWATWGFTPPPPKPGVIPLAPLGLGEVLNGVLTTLRRYVKALVLPLLGVALVATLLLAVYGVVGYLATEHVFQGLQDQPDGQLTDSQATAVGVLVVIGLPLLLLCYLLFSLVASTSGAAVLRHAVLGRPVTAGQLWSQTRPFLWRVLGVQLLLGLGGLGAVLVALLPAALAGLATGSGAVFGVLAALLVPVALGCSCYVGIRLTLLIPVLVLEDRRPIAAIRRAWALNRGAWWRSLGIPLVMRALGSFAVQAICVPASMLGSMALAVSGSTAQMDQYGDQATGAPSAFGVVVFIAVMLLALGVATLLLAPVGPLTDGLLYIDRRIRREGLADTLAEAAGIPTAPAAPGV